MKYDGKNIMDFTALPLTFRLGVVLNQKNQEAEAELAAHPDAIKYIKSIKSADHQDYAWCKAGRILRKDTSSLEYNIYFLTKKQGEAIDKELLRLIK